MVTAIDEEDLSEGDAGKAAIITSPMQPTKPHKLLVLDAMRGAAACAVVLFHRSGRFPFPHAYLAVDFFFMLSGFVLAFAYQSKLDAGWTTKNFLATRIARLYPLYFLGLLGGVLVAFSGPSTIRPLHDVPAAIMSLLLLPAWLGTHLGTPYAFPYNIPAWSLFLEIVANILHALLLRRRSTKSLTALTFIAAIVLIWTSGKRPVNFGADNVELLGGLSRVVFSYVAGMLLCRVWKKFPMIPSIPAPVPAVILLFLFTGIGASKIGAAFDLTAIIAIFPFLLLLGASASLAPSAAGVAQEFGAASYGVYILHHCVIQFLTIHGWLSPRGSQALHIAAALAFVAGMFLTASFIDRVYDTPARAGLKRLIAGDLCPAHEGTRP